MAQAVENYDVGERGEDAGEFEAGVCRSGGGHVALQLWATLHLNRRPASRHRHEEIEPGEHVEDERQVELGPGAAVVVGQREGVDVDDLALLPGAPKPLLVCRRPGPRG